MAAASLARSRPSRRRSSRRRRRTALDPLGRSRLLLCAGVAALLAAIATAPLVHRLHPSVRSGRLTFAEARAVNAALPIVPQALLPSQPYRFRGTPAARAQATDCLATAALYEAGTDVRGDRAVMPVVLNRVRRPGYPKTVCGVVYAGAQRRTGCQFSFTCDGSVTRRPEHRGWSQARALARRALAGAVDPVVGRATHYHTDWVAPLWAGTLVKVAKVGSHIFYQPRAAGHHVI